MIDKEIEGNGDMGVSEAEPDQLQVAVPDAFGDEACSDEHEGTDEDAVAGDNVMENEAAVESKKDAVADESKTDAAVENDKDAVAHATPTKSAVNIVEED